jgi:addiction module HigA family antidote
MKTTLRPFRPIKPGETLQEEMETRGLDATSMTERLGLPPTLIESIINGRREIDARVALALSQALGASPEYWLNLENAYRLDLAAPHRT